MAPLQAASSTPSQEANLNAPVEVEIVNLKLNATERTGEAMLVADADRDVDQTRDVDQGRRGWRA